MSWDPTLRLGDVVDAIALLLAALGMAFRLGKLEAKVAMLYEWFVDTIVRKEHWNE